MSGYRYEAFFSYKRDPQSDLWHKTVKEKIEHWLKQELQRTRIEIFFDTEDIRAGDRWRSKLSDALRQSKCLVCVWSPGYFESRWCVSEWLSFVEREKGNFGKHDGLIVPASYHDGEMFPLTAQEYQFQKFNKYASTMPFFWNTEDAYFFERDKLKDFAKDLAAKIRACPDYSDDFPLVEAKDDEVADEAVIRRVAEAAR